MKLTSYTYPKQKRNISGAMHHYVKNEAGEVIGFVEEVFSDVYYVKPYGRMYKDNTRYRTLESALTSPEWENAEPAAPWSRL